MKRSQINRWHIRKKKVERDLSHSLNWRYFSPASYAHYHTVVTLIEQYIAGRTIDLGCGFMPFKEYLTERVTAYHTLDLDPQSPEVTFIGDIQEMPMIPTNSYDSAICLEVLEHIPYPLKAIREIYRILKPGGIFLFSVPYLCRIHDQPHDYFRFTIYGLHKILSESQFSVIEIRPRGGIASFLGHQVSTILLTTTWPIWGLRQIAWIFNRWIIVLLGYEIDKIIGNWDIFPLGYVGVAQKPVNHHEETGPLRE